MVADSRSIAAQIFKLTESLDPREKTILLARFIAQDKLTLDAVGVKLNLTRERVRQLEKLVVAKLGDWLDSNDALRVFCDRIVDATGLVAPYSRILDEVPEIAENISIQDLPNGPLTLPAWRVIQGIDGSFEGDGSWFYVSSREEVVSLFHSKYDELSDGGKYIESGRVLDVFDGWGSANPEELFAWVQSIGYKIVHGALLPPGVRSMNDLAFIALALKGGPLTTAELHEAVAATKSIRSLANQMSTDQRLQRVGAESWGLVEWGGEAFTSIRDAILARVPVGESVHISELVEDIAVRFGVAESSVRTYASAWPLKSVKGMVSRQEELVTPQGRPFPRSKGAFVTTDGFAFRTSVTVDHLRGSGSQFPTALAVALGGSIGSSLFFDSAAGLGKIRIGWNGSQATISTIKAELEALGAKVGDEFAVFFRSSKVEVRILPPSTGHPYGDLGRLCLIPPSNEVSRINVAKALGLDETSVWDEIRQSASARKDPELITAVNGVIELLRKPV